MLIWSILPEESMKLGVSDSTEVTKREKTEVFAQSMKKED